MTAEKRKNRLQAIRNRSAYDHDWFLSKVKSVPSQYLDVEFLLSEIDRRDEALRVALECTTGKGVTLRAAAEKIREALGEEK